MTGGIAVPLILEAQSRQSDGIGGFRVVWVRLGVIHATMRAQNARLMADEVGAESRVAWRIETHAAPVGDPRRPRPGQRLRMGARVFAIDAVAEADAAGRRIFCIAREEEQA